MAAGKLAVQVLAAHQLMESCKVDPSPRASFGFALMPTDAACGRIADGAVALWLAGHRPPPRSPAVQDTG